MSKRKPKRRKPQPVKRRGRPVSAKRPEPQEFPALQGFVKLFANTITNAQDMYQELAELRTVHKAVTEVAKREKYADLIDDLDELLRKWHAEGKGPDVVYEPGELEPVKVEEQSEPETEAA